MSEDISETHRSSACWQLAASWGHIRAPRQSEFEARLWQQVRGRLPLQPGLWQRFTDRQTPLHKNAEEEQAPPCASIHLNI